MWVGESPGIFNRMKLDDKWNFLLEIPQMSVGTRLLPGAVRCSRDESFLLSYGRGLVHLPAGKV